MAARSPLVVSILAALVLFVPGCAADEEIDDGEPADSESAVVELTEPDETLPASMRAAAPLDHDDASDLIDVRGVGDSGWSKTHEATALPAAFGDALDRFDPSGKGYRGDLSFINWETVVGSSCTRFGTAYSPGRSYAFVSRPENIVQANERGFALFGLSNNHTRDCYASPEAEATGESASAEMTAKAIAKLGEGRWLFGGVASANDPTDFTQARVWTFQVKGRDVRVAFGSIYMGRDRCPNTACKADAPKLLASLRDANADLRILAIHSKAAADQDQLVRLGIDFVKSYGGDIVFGHGPHVWKPVRVVRKESGRTGVVFESLGNFIHPALGAQSKNFIGRALFDKNTLELRQVQVLPIANSGGEVRWSSVSGTTLQANLRWSSSERGVFANVKP